MPKRRRKRSNPVTNRNWLLFRVAGSITVLEPKHFEGECEEVKELAAMLHFNLRELLSLLKEDKANKAIRSGTVSLAKFKL